MVALGAALSTAGSWIGSNLEGIGSALGGISSLGSMFGLGSSGGVSLYKSAKLMEKQNELNKDYTSWLNENQYSQLRSGLEKAGYNPLLALGASPQSGSVGIATAQSGERQDLGALLSAMATIAQIKKTNAETEKINMTTGEKFIKNLDSITESLGFGKASEITKKVSDWFQNTAYKAGYDVADGIFKLGATYNDYTNTNSANSPSSMAPKVPLKRFLDDINLDKINNLPSIPLKYRR